MRITDTLTFFFDDVLKRWMLSESLQWHHWRFENDIKVLFSERSRRMRRDKKCVCCISREVKPQLRLIKENDMCHNGPTLRPNVKTIASYNNK